MITINGRGHKSLTSRGSLTPNSYGISVDLNVDGRPATDDDEPRAYLAVEVHDRSFHNPS